MANREIGLSDVQKLSPLSANKFHVTVAGGYVRIVFGHKMAAEENPSVHTSIVLNRDDAQELADVITKLLGDAV